MGASYSHHFRLPKSHFFFLFARLVKQKRLNSHLGNLKKKTFDNIELKANTQELVLLMKPGVSGDTFSSELAWEGENESWKDNFALSLILGLVKFDLKPVLAMLG